MVVVAFSRFSSNQQSTFLAGNFYFHLFSIQGMVEIPSTLQQNGNGLFQRGAEHAVTLMVLYIATLAADGISQALLFRAGRRSAIEHSQCQFLI